MRKLTVVITLLALINQGCSSDNQPQIYPLTDLSNLEINYDHDHYKKNNLPIIQIDPNRNYSLSELIDLGEKNNASTRISWLEAEKIANRIGFVEASFLPVVSLVILGEYSNNNNFFNNSISNTNLSAPVKINADKSFGYATGLNFEWLLFDFGERELIKKQAIDFSQVSNLKLNQTNRIVALEITQTFFVYSSSVQNATLANEHFNNAQKLFIAVNEKFVSGLATSIEVLQVKQLMEQAKLSSILAQGKVEESKNKLLLAIGLPSNTLINISSYDNKDLPFPNEIPSAIVFMNAVETNPEYLSALLNEEVTELEIDIIESSYLPKIGINAYSFHGEDTLNFDKHLNIDSSSSSQGVIIGFKMPIFDGFLKKRKIQEAQVNHLIAKELSNKTKNDILSQMFSSANALKMANATYESSITLVDTAKKTLDAAYTLYQSGAGEIMAVIEANNNLLIATQMMNTAFTDVLLSASHLAFLMGYVKNGSRNSK